MQNLGLGATREILWNAPSFFREHFAVVLHFLGLGLPFVLFAVWGLTILYPLYRWATIVRLGQPENRFDRLGERLQRALFAGVGQGYVVREPMGVVHQVLFVSFLTLFLGTALITVESDTPLDFYYGAFYFLYKLAMDLAGIGLIVASSIFLWRRWVRPTRLIAQPKKLLDDFENEVGYGIPLVLLWLIGVTGFLLEGARIVVNPRSSPGLAFVGPLVADGLQAMGADVGTHRTIWWVHLFIVLAFLYSLTSTKLRHMFIGPLNLFFSRLDSREGYRARPITDFENAETFGVEKVEEYSWKQMLDMAACLECGRCTINCPTATTGKVLNPKFLVIEQREHLLAKAPLLQAQRAALAAAARDGGAPAVEGDAASLAGGAAAVHATGAAAETGIVIDDAGFVGAPGLAGADMIREVATEAAIWGCTTCGWCEEGCPVAIEHIQRIVDMRRNAVLVRSEFPAELAKSFKGTENQSNPWGIAADRRAEWAEGLDVPLMAEIGEDEKVEVLYWVGCAGSFDERNQKTSRALIKIMQAAGVKFGILGTEEACTGEPARRLGNEYLYFTLATMNVEALKRYRFEKIVTQCPHCFNTIKNEYPDLGGKFEVVHTTQFIESLLAERRIKLTKDFMQKRAVLHDPCYLARHNDVHDAPRAALDAVPGLARVDVENSRRRTYCCGAGGGQFWKEEEHETQRINQNRFEQLMEAKPDTVAVGCPFCMTMIGDAAKAKGEESVAVKDVVEIVSESLA